MGMEISLNDDGTMFWTFQDKQQDVIEGTWRIVDDQVYLTPKNQMILSFWKRMFPSSTSESSLALTYDPGRKLLSLPAPMHLKEAGQWVFTRQ